MKQCSSFTKRLPNYCFTIQEKKVESENADFDFHVLDFDILLLASHELLKRKDFFFVEIPGYRFAIQDKGFSIIFHPGVELG